MDFARDRMYPSQLRLSTCKTPPDRGPIFGRDITSDGGLLLRRQADRRLGLLEAVNARPLIPAMVAMSDTSS